MAVSAGCGQLGPGLLVTFGFTAVLAALMARTRGKLGVQGLRGDAMLLELRDRLKSQSELPPLPKDWGGRWCSSRPGAPRSAATSWSPCATATSWSRAGRRLRQGRRRGHPGAACCRAPSAACSARCTDFLPACNAYLHRQRGDEGFVTAVHLRLDLATGEYTITSAGHPPVVKFDAGTGTWRVSTAKGVVLGVVPDLHCETDSGMLRKGDALMLYTDGLIEQPGRDIDAGLDRLLGEAERLLPSGFRDGARAAGQRHVVGAQRRLRARPHLAPLTSGTASAARA